MVVRHAFIGNDDDCHVHHIQVEVRMNILEAEEVELNRKTVVLCINS